VELHLWEGEMYLDSLDWLLAFPLSGTSLVSGFVSLGLALFLRLLFGFGLSSGFVLTLGTLSPLSCFLAFGLRSGSW
jgi:hypothetical protein